MDCQTILVTVENRIAVVTLNRPEYGNAFTRESYVEIADAMEDPDSRRDVGSIVATGAGRRFPAGGNIKCFRAFIDSKEYLDGDSVAGTSNMSIAIREYPRPVIAMINGVATGAGLSCALVCDFWAVVSSSKMIMAFVNMGPCGDTGSIYSLIHLIGPDKAGLLMTIGDTCCGEDYVRMGPATLLAKEGRLQEITYNLTSKLAGKSSAAHAGQKRLIKKYFYGGLADFVADEGKEIVTASRLSDFTEAINAFLEKRTPEYNK